MSEAFYLPSGDSIFIGLSAPCPADISVREGERGTRPRTLFAGADAAAGSNDRGLCVAAVSVPCRFGAAAPDALARQADRLLAGTDTAEAARDALLEATAAGGEGGASILLSGADGAFLVETAGKRWAWRQLDGPVAIGPAYSITHDYKRLDADTRKSIAPVNERMACLDEADPGRIGDKDSWKAYMRAGGRRKEATADSLKRAVEALLGAAMESGGIASAFAVLRAHGISDPVHPGRAFDLCGHGGFFRDRSREAALLSAGSDRTRTDAWFTGAPWACVNLFKPVMANGAPASLWSGCDLGPEGGQSREDYRRRRRTALGTLARNTRQAEDLAAELAEAQAAIVSVAADFAAGILELEAARSKVNAIVAAWDGV